MCAHCSRCAVEIFITVESALVSLVFSAYGTITNCFKMLTFFFACETLHNSWSWSTSGVYSTCQLKGVEASDEVKLLKTVKVLFREYEMKAAEPWEEEQEMKAAEISFDT